MPQFTKVFSLFADWHRTESRHKSFIDKIKCGFQSKKNMKRTEQLGLPPPRKLIATKQEFRHILEERRLKYLDKHLDSSLKTVYSKLIAQKSAKSAKKSPKKKKQRSLFKSCLPKKNNNEAKEKYEKWLMNFAKPKRQFAPEEPERVTGYVDIDRIRKLSQPRYRPGPEPQQNGINRETLKYVATERILSLAQPKWQGVIHEETVFEIPRIVYPPNPEYQAIKSHGTANLAIPKHKRDKHIKVNVDIRCSYDKVSRAALQYEASDKIRKLAKAKTYEEEESVDPYQVKKKALRKLQKKQEQVFEKMSTPITWKCTPKYEKK